MARPAGLEPATPDLEGRCSIRMSYGRVRSQFNRRPGRQVLAVRSGVDDGHAAGGPWEHGVACVRRGCDPQA